MPGSTYLYCLCHFYQSQITLILQQYPQINKKQTLLKYSRIQQIEAALDGEMEKMMLHPDNDHGGKCSSVNRDDFGLDCERFFHDKSVQIRDGRLSWSNFSYPSYLNLLFIIFV